MMVPVSTIDELDTALDATWRTLCEMYNVSAPLPEAEALFAGVAFGQPLLAAETILANILTEISEDVGRFSPWYKKPARSFGLIDVRDGTTKRVRWILAPEAAQRWELLLRGMAVAIQKHSGVLQATQLVDALMGDEDDDPCILARCTCQPYRTILIARSMLASGDVICDDCHHVFVPVEAGGIEDN
jgi:hypothetical protein